MALACTKQKVVQVSLSGWQLTRVRRQEGAANPDQETGRRQQGRAPAPFTQSDFHVAQRIKCPPYLTHLAKIITAQRRGWQDGDQGEAHYNSLRPISVTCWGSGRCQRKRVFLSVFGIIRAWIPIPALLLPGVWTRARCSASPHVCERGMTGLSFYFYMMYMYINA